MYQVWWNEARTKKPQTFKSESLELPDSTENGKNCDFCRWDILTAADTFGRYAIAFSYDTQHDKCFVTPIVSIIQTLCSGNCSGNRNH